MHDGINGARDVNIIADIGVNKAEAAGFVEAGFDELAKRWKPILDVYEENGIDLCYEVHPSEDLHDGVTF